MGNRAVITTSKALDIAKSDDIGVYLHWNGGRDSVEAFLLYCKMHEYRAPESDNYGWARLCQVVANYFGKDGLSVGVDKCCNLDCDNWGNGVYVIENWEIVKRVYFNGEEQCDHDLELMLYEIDASMPAEHQLGGEFIMEYLKERAKLAKKEKT